jgi:bifunctional non-homologous end joining protein LigD
VGCFPELVDEIRPIPHDFVADSEHVVLHNQGRPQWDRLQKRQVIRYTPRIRQAAAEDPAVIFAFDLLWLNGADSRPRSLLERKDALHRTLPANRRIRYARHLSKSSSDLWRMSVQMELEGIMAKDARPGGRRSRLTLARIENASVGRARGNDGKRLP